MVNIRSAVARVGDSMRFMVDEYVCACAAVCVTYEAIVSSGLIHTSVFLFLGYSPVGYIC